MTEARPSLARKHTRATETNRKSELDAGFRITVGDDPENLDVFEVRMGDVSQKLTREFRRVTGYSVNRLLELMADDPDLDTLTDFEWLARLIRGEDVTHEQIEFTYDDIATDHFGVEDAGPAPVQKGPVQNPEI